MREKYVLSIARGTIRQLLPRRHAVHKVHIFTAYAIQVARLNEVWDS